MTRKTWYFKKLVTTQFVEDTFDFVENAVDAVAKDLGALGISEGGLVSQHSPSANLSIDIQPLIARDVNGKRIELPTLANLLVDNDSGGNVTNPSGPTFEKWLGIFVKYVKKLEDPTTDGNGDTVYVTRRDWYELNVTQGAQAAIGLAVMPASPGVEWVRICDVLRHHDSIQNVVLNADIDYSLRDNRTVANASEVAYDDPFSRFPPSVETVEEALDLLRLDQTNDEATIQALLEDQAELLNRYYSVGATDLRLYLDPDTNLLYSMKGELYAAQDIAIASDGTRICLVFETTEDGITRKIIARMFNPGSSTYDDERLIARGNVRAPKVAFCGTNFAITWLTEPDPTGAPGDFQINMRKLSPGNVLVGTTVTNVNGYLTRPLRPEVDVDFQRRLYDIAYDAGTDKLGIVFGFDNQIFFRSITVGTETLGSTIVQVDDSGSTADDYVSPTIASGNNDFGVSYIDTTGGFACFRAVEPVGGVETMASVELPSGAISGLLTDQNYIAWSALNSYFVLTALDNVAAAARLLRVDAAYAAIAQYATFNGGGVGLVEHIYGITYNTASNVLLVTFADSAVTQKVLGKETTDLALSGSVIQFSGTSDDYHQGSNITSKPLKLGSNYYFLTTEPDLSAPFNIRKFRQVAAPQLSSGVQGVVTEWKQGSGGYLTYLLRQNSRKIIKYRFVQFDGDSIALADKSVVSFLVAPSMFTDSSEQVLIDNIEPADTTTLVVYANTLTNYNQPIAIYRHDEALGTGAFVVGNQSYSAGPFRVWNPTKADVDLAVFLDEQAAVDARLDDIETLKSTQVFNNLVVNPGFFMSSVSATKPDYWAESNATVANDALPGTITVTGTASGGSILQSIQIKEPHIGKKIRVRAWMSSAAAGAARIRLRFIAFPSGDLLTVNGDPVANDDVKRYAEAESIIPASTNRVEILIGDCDSGEVISVTDCVALIGEFVNQPPVGSPVERLPEILTAGSVHDGSNYHNHNTQYYTKAQLTAGQLDSRYYTETELNTSAAGGQVHYDNVTNKPIWLHKIYDLIVDRADYASNAAAGTALKAALESGSYRSVFIKNGTYDLGNVAATGIAVSSFTNLIVGESLRSVVVTGTATAGPTTKLIALINDCVVRNVVGSWAASANFSSVSFHCSGSGAVYKFEDCIADSLQTADTGTGFFIDAASGDAHALNCRVTGYGDQGFSGFRGSVVGCSAPPMVTGTFTSCNNISGVRILDRASAFASAEYYCFNTCIGISNVIVDNQTASFSSCQNFSLFISCFSVTGVYWAQTTAVTMTAGRFRLIFGSENVTNVRITLPAVTLTYTSGNADLVATVSKKLTNINITWTSLAMSASTNDVALIRDTDYLNDVRIQISTVTGTYDQFIGVVGCDDVMGLRIALPSIVAGGNATAADKVIGALGPNHNYTNCIITIIPTTLCGSCYTSIYGVTGCIATGTVAGTTRGYGECERVVGCRANTVATSYVNGTGYANTYSAASGAPSGVTTLGAIATSSATETAPTL